MCNQEWSCGRLYIVLALWIGDTYVGSLGKYEHKWLDVEIDCVQVADSFRRDTYSLQLQLSCIDGRTGENR